MVDEMITELSLWVQFWFERFRGVYDRDFYEWLDTDGRQQVLDVIPDE